MGSTHSTPLSALELAVTTAFQSCCRRQNLDNKSKYLAQLTGISLEQLQLIHATLVSYHIPTGTANIICGYYSFPKYPELQLGQLIMVARRQGLEGLIRCRPWLVALQNSSSAMRDKFQTLQLDPTNEVSVRNFHTSAEQKESTFKCSNDEVFEVFYLLELWFELPGSASELFPEERLRWTIAVEEKVLPDRSGTWKLSCISFKDAQEQTQRLARTGGIITSVYVDLKCGKERLPEHLLRNGAKSEIDSRNKCRTYKLDITVHHANLKWIIWALNEILADFDGFQLRQFAIDLIFPEGTRLEDLIHTLSDDATATSLISCESAAAIATSLIPCESAAAIATSLIPCESAAAITTSLIPCESAAAITTSLISCESAAAITTSLISCESAAATASTSAHEQKISGSPTLCDPSSLFERHGCIDLSNFGVSSSGVYVQCHPSILPMSFLRAMVKAPRYSILKEACANLPTEQAHLHLLPIQ